MPCSVGLRSALPWEREGLRSAILSDAEETSGTSLPSPAFPACSPHPQPTSRFGREREAGSEVSLS